LGRTMHNPHTGKTEHVFYCPICRKDLPGYNPVRDRQKLILEHRWDFKKNRMLHCGSSTCRDYQEEWDKEKQERTLGLYERMRKVGLVA